MTLSDYLGSTGESHAAFARRCGVSRITIFRVVHGAVPSLDTALAISRETHGNVMFDVIRETAAAVSKAVA